MTTLNLVGDPATAVVGVCEKFTAAIARKTSRSHALQYTVPESFCVLHYVDALYMNTFREALEGDSATFARLCGNATSNQSPNAKPDVWVKDNIAAVMSKHLECVDGTDRYRGARFFSMLKDDDTWKIVGWTESWWKLENAVDKTISVREVMAPIESFFASLTRYDWDALAAGLMPGGGATLSRRPQPPAAHAWPEFVARLKKTVASLPSGSTIVEKIHDCKVQECGDLALAWTPFVVELNGQIRSRGINIFTLIQLRDEWIISGVQDTQFL